MTDVVPSLLLAGAPPAWTIIPFALLLLSIALLPLLAPGWWHHRSSQAWVSAGFGVPSIAIVLWLEPAALGHAALEYVAFVALLGSLFTISGGVRLAGRLAGTPNVNTALLAIGAVLANVVGTTGAAMLLVRPFLRANAARSRRTHLVVFFILVVANCGGCLTPLGDPPLFLGFLRGVPFEWTLRLWPQWLAVCAGLLILFRVVDSVMVRREIAPVADGPADSDGGGALRFEGRASLALLAVVALVVYLSGAVVHPRWGETAALLSQSVALLALGSLSLRLGPAGLRERNGFTWGPLAEVAILFAAIFVAMVPALAFLRVAGAEAGLEAPWQLFWATGMLSAFLDNAPTYLAFVAAVQHLPDEVVGTSHAALEAIACGAVFFGALTYIGNGPNFMVKAIAEEAGVRMPSFFGYLGLSFALLAPLLAAVTLAWFC
jgi:Na+/H+ antiporter NhaD/arsenite permease-like protein